MKSSIFFLSASIFLLLWAHFPLYAQVNHDGSYAYSIPISIPPGVQGVQPQLSLSYNSNAKDGLLGLGWQLSSIPVITRKNWTNSIQYENSDTFWGPDGLLIPQGNGVYWAQRENWGKYEWNDDYEGHCTVSICSWKLTDKHGNVTIFGGTDDSRIEGVNQRGQIRTFAMSSFTDVYGNYYSIEYLEDQEKGNFYPNKITYTQGNGLPENMHVVEFWYGENVGDPPLLRPDRTISYAQASKVVQDQLLRWITVKSHNQLVRKYEFVYELSNISQRSRLSGLKDHGNGQGPTEPLQYQFFWKNETPITILEKDKPIQITGTSGNLGVVSTTLMDFNGDGVDDIVEKSMSYTSEYKFCFFDSCTSHYYYDYSLNYSFHLTITGQAERIHLLSPSWSFSRYSNHFFNPSALPGDYDGNGVNDLLIHDRVFYWSNGEVKTKVVIPEKLNKNIVGDFNGDGLTDFIADGYPQGRYISKGYFEFEEPLWLSNGPGNHKQNVGDFNGDEIADYILSNSPSLWDYFYIGLSTRGGTVTSTGASMQPSEPGGILIGDFNGDGKTDYIYSATAHNSSHALDLYTSRGKADHTSSNFYPRSFVEKHSIPIHRFSGPIESINANDFNRDGKTDLYVQNRVMLSRGDRTFIEVPHRLVSPAEKVQEVGLSVVNQIEKIITPTYKSILIDYQVSTNFDEASEEPSTPIDLPFEEWPGIEERSDGNYDVTDEFVALLWGRGIDFFLSYWQTHPMPREGLFGFLKEYYPHVAQGILFDVPTPFPKCMSEEGTEVELLGCGIPNTSKRWLTASVTIEDGRGGQHQRTRYDYKNGRRILGRLDERKDLGFQTISEAKEVEVNGIFHEISSKKTDFIQHYMPSAPFHGLPVRVSHYVANELISETQFTYDEEHLFPHETQSVYQTLLKSKTQKTYVNDALENYYFEEYTRDHFGRMEMVENCATENTEIKRNCLLTLTDYVEWERGKRRSYQLFQQKVVREKNSGRDTIGQVLSADRYDYQSDEGGNNPDLLQLKKTSKFRCGGGTRRDRCFMNSPVFRDENAWQIVRQELKYDSRGELYSEKNSKGVATSQTRSYSTEGSTLSTRFPNGGTTQQIFNPDGTLHQNIGMNPGDVTTYQHDAYQRLQKVTNPSGGLTEYQYKNGPPQNDQHFVQSTVTDRDSNGILISTEQTTVYSDGLGRVYRTDSLADSTHGFDQISRVDQQATYQMAGETLPTLVRRTSLPYFVGDTPKFIETRYDKRGRKAFRNRPKYPGDEVSYLYGPNTVITIQHVGNDSQMRLGNHGVVEDLITIEKYSARGLLLSKEDSNRAVHSYTAWRSSPEHFPGKRTDYRYDSAGRLTWVGLPVGSDGVRQQTRIKYNTLGQKTELVDPSTGTTRYRYDTEGNLLSLTDNMGNVTRYSYDTSNRLITKTGGFKKGHRHYVRSTRFYYDSSYSKAIGRLYFSRTRLEYYRWRYSSHYRRWYRWRVTEAYSNERLRYNTSGLVTYNYKYIEGRSFSETMTYSQQGKLISHRFPDGTKQSMDYTPRGNLHKVWFQPTTNDGNPRTLVGTFSDYDASQRFQKKRLANGVVTHYNYDDETGTLDTLRTELERGTNDPYQDLEYTFNNAGFLKKITDHRSDSLRLGTDRHWVDTNATQTFHYDSVGRLTEARWDSNRGSSDAIQQMEYGYDDIGNLTSKNTERSKSTVRARSFYRGQQIQAVSDENDNLLKSFNYDECRYEYSYYQRRYIYRCQSRGNMQQKETSKGVQTYAYDVDNQLISIRESGRPTLEFVYDAGGQRRKKTYFSRAGYFDKFVTWYPSSSYELRQNETGEQTVTKYIFAGGHGKIATITNRLRASAPALRCDRNSRRSIEGSTTDGVDRGVFYYHTDHLGSSSVVTNCYGEEVSLMNYLPFGSIEVNRSVGKNLITHKYTGQELDEESNLYYYNARYYDPSLGRFMTADSIVPDPRNLQSYNRYSYVLNNPIIYNDPTGHWENYPGEKVGSTPKGETQAEKHKRVNRQKEYHSSAEHKHTKSLGNKASDDYKSKRLHFDGNNLTLTDENGDLIDDWPAVSGKPGTTAENQYEPWKGPLPEGEYSVDPKKADRYNWWDPRDRDWGEGLRDAWGDARTPIDPFPDTNLGSRNGGFFIHGGKYPGSAGCIDLTNSNNDFHDVLERYNSPLNLTVNY